ncbi:MAG: prepilin-type cleavage/methylation domain-containing protein [Gammaproteobacteria bacterium]|nr:prepilin-type cleavage/methylation domain-containing protein [Gammaproteobacteria bacterium]MDE2252324.1 prepilin-type cleavage/methylation domain-containing protein [Gammaproteobacteria bacterium]
MPPIRRLMCDALRDDQSDCARGPERHGVRSGAGGYTFIELSLVLCIAALLSMIAVPGYKRYVLRAQTAAAITDIGRIQLTIGRYMLANNGQPPANLATIGMDAMVDPWGKPYAYLSFANGNGGARKDKGLHPLNTDYDLYSFGPDGASSLPLTAKVSRDDIIRANDGSFIGTAVDY